MDAIDLLIADDSAPFRAGLRSLLQTVDDIVIVGEAVSGAQAVQLAKELQPDVVLMDLQMQDGNGIDATRQIVHTSPHIRILMLTMFEEEDSVFAALRAGARGYLLKGALKAEIVRAVRAVHNGEAIFGSAIAKRLLQFFSAPGPVAPAQLFPELTDREREILKRMAQHETNIEIADRLALAPKTVRNHVSNIFSKLQVADRAQAIIKAREAGLK